MRIISDLTMISERCRSASLGHEDVLAKGDDSILEFLNDHYPSIKELSEFFKNLEEVRRSIYKWRIYLDANYQARAGRLTILKIEDAKILGMDVDSWISSIINIYARQGTVYITQNSLEELFSQNLLSEIDAFTKADLDDALSCILHLIPTPAAMISFRAAESIVRNLYMKLTGNSPERKSLYKILDELEKGNVINRPLLGYLHYIRDKRNEAEHPEKRFSQEESERILLKIKDILEEVKKLS